MKHEFKRHHKILGGIAIVIIFAFGLITVIYPMRFSPASKPAQMDIVPAIK